MSYNEDLQQHNSDLEEVLAMAQTLPDAGVQVETCTVTIINQHYYYCTLLTYTAFEGGELVTKQVENPFAYNEAYETEAVVLENVVKGTSIVLCPDNCDGYFDCENAEYWFVAQAMADELGWYFFNFRILGDATITSHP